MATMSSAGAFSFSNPISTSTSSNSSALTTVITSAGVVTSIGTTSSDSHVTGGSVTAIVEASTASSTTPLVSSSVTVPAIPVVSSSPSVAAVPPVSISPTTDLTKAVTSNGLFSDDFKLDESFEVGSIVNGSPSENDSTSYQLDGGSLNDLMDQDCSLCHCKFSSPRVLSCLHVFCESCLDKRLGEESGERKQEGILDCPECTQTTTIGMKGAAGLHQDYILSNVLDLSSIEPSMLACTSCKSKENAISRCNDCANFLCASCEYAHQHMRCFEDHRVVQLDDLRKSAEKVAIHKPLYCSVHATENLKYFCFHCQIPLCNECVIGDHNGNEHNYQIISEAEKPMRVELEKLVKDAKTKIDYCNQASNNLNSSLNELQSQFESARDLINESFQSFKAVLESCRDNALQELKKLHYDRELKIMELFHSVEKSADKIDNASKFTKKVLDQANGPELLSLKKMISTQFGHLMNATPKADVSYSIEFQTSFEKFEQVAPELFGTFRTEVTPPSPQETTPPPTLPPMPILINKSPANNGSCGLSQGPLTGSVTASSPISMQSSFDGEMSNLGTGYMLPTVLTPEPPAAPIPTNHISATPTPVGGPTTIPGLTSIAEYNLHRLANLAETSSDITDAMVPVNNNPSNYTLADLISGDQNAFQALAGTMLTPHPAIDNVPLLNDFTSLPGPTSPILPSNGALSMDGSMNSEMSMNRFQPSICVNGRNKATPMQIRCKFGSLGQTKGQFNSPHGFCLGVDEEIVVADTNNHRIEVFEKNGTFKFTFGVPGKEEGQLFYPRKVAVMRNSAKFVVCDRGNERSRMQIFSKNGHFIKKIAIRYIDIVAGLAVTNKGLIVAVDSVSPTVFIISEDGTLIHWFDCSDFMREPSDIAINGSDFFVCDFKGHCVAVFSEEGTFKYRIGSEKTTCFPNGIDISDAGDVLIGDSHGNRFHVACYSKDGQLQSEYECPYVKVSRCCGLKITSEGYVVTLAKNNHHVLVLNTLYIQ